MQGKNQLKFRAGREVPAGEPEAVAVKQVQTLPDIQDADVIFPVIEGPRAVVLFEQCGRQPGAVVADRDVEAVARIGAEPPELE